MKRILPAVGAVALLASPESFAQFNVNPLSSFGGGDGWLSPGEGGYAFLGTANNERGIAYGNGHLYLVSRSGGVNVRVLNPLTGADLNTPLDVTGISGGTFALSMIAVGGDGAIYGGNLTVNSTTSPLKVYRWANEAAVPTVAYSGDAGLAGSRVGDSLSAFGSGAATLLAFGFGSAPAVAGNNGYTIVNPTAGTAAPVGFGTPPNAGDFRLGIAFSDASHIWGSQGGAGPFRYTSFSGTAGTLLGSFSPASNAERLMAFTTIKGVPILAVQSTGDSHVSLYDVTDPLNPLLVTSGNNTSGTLTANANGTGELAWGETIDNGDGSISQQLYAMSSNQGIQAFIVTVPEPGILSIGAAGLVLGWLLRRSRAQA